MGRLATSIALPSSERFSYETKKKLALALPPSSFIAYVPAVALYFRGLPLTVISWSVTESLSPSAPGLGLPLSDSSVVGLDCGCSWAKSGACKPAISSSAIRIIGRMGHFVRWARVRHQTRFPSRPLSLYAGRGLG